MYMNFCRPSLSNIHVFSEGVEILDFQTSLVVPDDYFNLCVKIREMYCKCKTSSWFRNLIIFEANPDSGALYRLHMDFESPFDFSLDLIK